MTARNIYKDVTDLCLTLAERGDQLSDLSENAAGWTLKSRIEAEGRGLAYKQAAKEIRDILANHNISVDIKR